MGKSVLLECLNMSVIVGFNSCTTSVYRISKEAVKIRQLELTSSSYSP